MKKEQINIFKIAMPIHEMKSESNRQARRDFERMSRILFNRSIAVVLGGGGARGISHLGVLRALEEEGIPVDIVGGTSMGAFVAGLYAKTQSVQETYRLTEHFSKGVRTMTYVLQDLTLPLLSATTGKKFNSQIAEVFSDDLLSGDLKLDFFCSVTNMSKGSKNQTFYPHTNPIWQICRASMGIPPFAPPISVEGDLLIDGAFTANVPVFPAQGLGAETIFAFDVGYMDPLVDEGTHETISGWAIFWGKILKKLGWKGPMAKKANLPTLMDIINHVSYATHTNELRLIKSLPGCLYLHQPTAHIPTASYAMFNESYRVGYDSAKKWLENLKGQGVFDHLAIGGRIRAEDGFVGFNFDGIEQGEV
jgi:predicted acylesterase/phospholipase RssA